ncbi:MAG: hypothetical protein K2Z80_37095 [Xanthobacteraceae bacterium]|nr:hypothetical protein [Xanthobacteraceae bacterium]
MTAAKSWVEDFTVKVAVPIARGERPRSEPVVVGISGVMGRLPCISGTRIPAATRRSPHARGRLGGRDAANPAGRRL